jgi:molecular chaperone HtpG
MRQHRDAILPLCRFHSTRGEGLVSLDEYIAAMKEGQEAIYTISGENLESIRQSPQLEGFKAKGIEVLLLDDSVDDFWVPSVGQYQEKPFKSVTQGGADLANIKDAEGKPKDDKKDQADDADVDALIAALKVALGDKVKDIRSSQRLTESAVCLVADEGDLDIRLEKMLRQHNQLQEGMASKRILEINPAHPTITRMAAFVKENSGAVDGLNEAALLLVRSGAVARRRNHRRYGCVCAPLITCDRKRFGLDQLVISWGDSGEFQRRLKYGRTVPTE